MRRTIAAAALALAAAGCADSHTASSPPASQPAATAARPPATEVIAARMHLRHVVAYTAVTDPNHLLGRQGGYTSNVDAGPTYSPGSTGSIGIEIYPEVTGAVKRVAYLRTFSGSFLGDGYDYRDGAAILRLDSHYTPAQARALDAAFRSAVSG